jgi:hypothetical protein
VTEGSAVEHAGCEEFVGRPPLLCRTAIDPVMVISLR